MTKEEIKKRLLDEINETNGYVVPKEFLEESLKSFENSDLENKLINCHTFKYSDFPRQKTNDFIEMISKYNGGNIYFHEDSFTIYHEPMKETDDECFNRIKEEISRMAWRILQRGLYKYRML